MGYYGELDGQVMEQNILLIIDPQMDFCDPYRGTLYVDGAVQDMFRLSDFIEHNKALFDHIIVSLDSHSLYQPFHPDFWVAGDSPAAKRNGLFYNVGENPQPFIDISLDDMEDDIWVPVHRSNFNRMVSMFKQLKEHGQVLTIWPVHCILGTPGHAVHPRLMEAINVHSRYWRNSCDMVIKR